MQKNQVKKILIDLDLSKRVLSSNPRTKLEAERELKLSHNICRSSKVLFRRSKFTETGQIIYLQRGQYFTTYRLLTDLWGCSFKAARYQLQKWNKSKLITTSKVKDQKGFDLGLVINYNPVFIEKDWGTRQSPKSRQVKGTNSSQGAPLSVKNFHRKTTKEVVFLNDIDFGKRVVGKLLNLNFSHSEIDKLYLNYSIDQILDYHRLLKLSKKVTNPKAFLKASLKSKYSLKLVKDCREVERIKAMEVRKGRNEAIEKLKIEKDRLLQEERKAQVERERQNKINTWLQDASNRVKYENEALNIVEQAESNKDIKPTIETIQNRSLTRSNYKHYKELYDKKIDLLTQEAIKTLEAEYAKIYVDLVRAGDLTADKMSTLLKQKHDRILGIKTLDTATEKTIKIAVVQEIPSLNIKLDTWLDNQIEQSSNQKTTTVDQALATTSQANSWGIGESDPNGLVSHELACSLQKTPSTNRRISV